MYVMKLCTITNVGAKHISYFYTVMMKHVYTQNDLRHNNDTLIYWKLYDRLSDLSFII